MNKLITILYTIFVLSIGFVIGHELKDVIHSPKENNTINKKRTVNEQISDYDCIIRNSTNPDTIRWYQQKKELLIFEQNILLNNGRTN